VVSLQAEGISTPEILALNMIMSLSVTTPHCYFAPGVTNVFTGREELHGQLRIFHKGNSLLVFVFV
jgi:hypothetical protein